MDAGIIAGKGIIISPSDGSYPAYRYGVGVAPGLRVGATKIVNEIGKTDGVQGNELIWAQNAVTAQCGGSPPWCSRSGNCAASIQNHSHNDYYEEKLPLPDPANPYGTYTLNSQMFDTVVRDPNRRWPASSHLR